MWYCNDASETIAQPKLGAIILEGRFTQTDAFRSFKNKARKFNMPFIFEYPISGSHKKFDYNRATGLWLDGIDSFKLIISRPYFELIFLVFHWFSKLKKIKRRRLALKKTILSAMCALQRCSSLSRSIMLTTSLQISLESCHIYKHC